MKFLEKLLTNRGYAKVETIEKEVEDQITDRGLVTKEAAHNLARKMADRAFEAAKTDRLTSGWITSLNNIEKDIEEGGLALRARARDFIQNNDYAANWLKRILINVVGPKGFKLTNKAKDSSGQLDKPANDLIESAWNEWKDRKYCTMAGQLNFTEVCRLLLTYLERDGEYFIRLVRPLRRSVNKFGFSLEIIEPDEIELGYNKERPNGNIIIMGVEFNKWRKPVAYWIRQRSAKAELYHAYYKGYKLQRVPAEEIIHGFYPEYYKQGRGYSPLAPSLLRLHHLAGWEKASLVNATVSANKMGFFYKEGIDGQNYDGDEVDGEGNTVIESKAGSFEWLPDRVRFQGWDPKYPTEQHGPYLETQLRAFTGGQGQNYNLFSGDLKGATYSALKAGRGAENDNWIVKQDLFIEKIKEIFSEWLKYALLSGAIDLPIYNYDEYNKPIFTGRTWKQLEPYKEANANKLKRAAGWISDQEIAAEDGKNLEDIYQDIAEAEKLKQKYGIKFNSADPEKENNGEPKDPDETDVDKD